MDSDIPQMSKNNMKERINMELRQVDAVLRPMKIEDSEMVMKWRMLPEITKYMNTDPQLSLDSQISWFNKQKINPDNYLWILEVDKIPVGVLTILDIDRQNLRCSSGLYIAVKEKRSLDLAMQLEWSLYDFVFDYLKLNKTYAEIFTLNKGLIRLKQMCGSVVEGVLKEHIYKNNIFYDVTVMAMYKERWKEIREKFNYNNIPFLK